MNRILFICLLLVSVFPGVCQTENKPEKEEIFYRHTITTSIGRASRFSQEGDYTPKSFGADYLYRLNPKWEVGAQFDLGFADQNKDSDLFLVVGIAAFSINDRWPVFGGFGVENRLLDDETDFLGRLGTEYTFFLGKKKHFAILPGAFVDFTKHGPSSSAVLAFGFFF